MTGKQTGVQNTPNDLGSAEPLDPCELAPSYIRAIAPYQPGKPITELAREFGLDERKIVKLASNENPSGLSPRARAAIEAALAEREGARLLLTAVAGIALDADLHCACGAEPSTWGLTTLIGRPAA